MRLSTRSRYGTRLMVDLAENSEKGYTRLKEAAKRQGISMKYLEQIVIPLKRAGLIEGVRGAKGGYRLARAPGRISVGEIVAVLEKGKSVTACSEDASLCGRSRTCPTRAVWQEAAGAIYEKLDSITLADLTRKERTGSGL